MIDTTFKEKFENFMSYVKLLAFLIIAGGGGYFFYQKYSQNKTVETTTVTNEEGIAVEVPVGPIAVENSKPSKLLRPVVDANMALLSSGFNEVPATLLADFPPVEEAVTRALTIPGKMQPAWKVASQICKELQATLVARNAAAAIVLARSEVKVTGSKSAPISKAELADRESKKEFFIKGAQQRWDLALAERRKKINALFSQLLAIEAQAD